MNHCSSKLCCSKVNCTINHYLPNVAHWYTGTLGRCLAEPLPGAKGCTSYLSIFLSTLNPLGQYRPVQATHQIRMRQFFSEDPHGSLENVSYNCCTNRNQNATSVLKAFPKFSPNSYISEINQHLTA